MTHRCAVGLIVLEFPWSMEWWGLLACAQGMDGWHQCVGRGNFVHQSPMAPETVLGTWMGDWRYGRKLIGLSESQKRALGRCGGSGPQNVGELRPGFYPVQCERTWWFGRQPELQELG